MPKVKKEGVVKDLPKDLPMPKYQYQKPATGNFTYRYEERSVDDKKKAAPKFSLRHLVFDI